MICALVLESQTPDPDGKYRFTCPACNTGTRNRNPGVYIKRTCKGRAPDHGPGAELAAIFLELGIKSCNACKAMARRMDALGTDGCRRLRSELAADIQGRAEKKGWGAKIVAAAAALLSGLAWRLDRNDLYGSLIDEAIRRAEANQSANRG